ncbi:hypothetical protein [Chryseobacterium sp. CCH4-E10]|uniref:hypothetical protein n=1 Tax=Chryseobacterium sp. CCH4-E10 TaxID=1768758 RepID=UPI000835852F|nr:hypothetical protein [Chryseobacterium sp. CCH4-E10]
MEWRPIASDIITQIENKLIELELIKNNNFIIEDLQHRCSNIENLQIEYSSIKDLINNCKEFVYNQNQELSFRFYDKLKEKVSILISEQNILARELQKLGSDRNYELESIFDDLNFDMSAFSKADKLSNNKQQSDDFNSFVDVMIERLNFQSSSEIRSKSIEAKNKYPSGIEDIHPIHDPNLWNERCYELFKYLFDNYYDGKTLRKLINIWYFLKEKTSIEYSLLATKEKYKDFIIKKYNIPLKNTTRAADKFKEKEAPSMNEHRQNFENFLLDTKNT